MSSVFEPSRCFHLEPPSRVMRSVAGLSVVLACGCVTDHDALAKRPDEGPSSGGMANVPDPPEADATPDAVRTEAAPVEDSAPGGPYSLTLLHAVVDETQRVAFCFAPVVDGVRRPARGRPIPEPGLAFGESILVREIEGVDFVADGVLPILVAGDLAQLAGLECEEAIARAESPSAPAVPPAGAEAGAHPEGGAAEGGSAADGGARSDAQTLDAALPNADAADAADAVAPRPAPPPVRAARLAILPRGTVAPGMSHLLVAYGCIGGPAFTAPDETSICGDDYGPSRATLRPLLVRPSTTVTPGKVGLQFVNPSLALESAELQAIPIEQSSASDYVIATAVGPGQIAPRVPAMGRDALALGANGDEAELHVFAAGSSVPVYEKPWARALEIAGVSSVEDGRAYTLVLAGPSPSIPRAAWWNGAAVTIVENTR